MLSSTLHTDDLARLIGLHIARGTADLSARMQEWRAGETGNANGCCSVAFLDAVGARADAGARSLAAVYSRMGASAVTILDDDYPPRVRTLLGWQAPPVLYWVGNRELLRDVAVAVIGTRRPGRHGLAAARSYAARMAGAGCVIVSGNARGVDAAAHEAALACGGATIVCPPAALERYSPAFPVPAGADDRMLVLSRFVPASETDKWFFLARNEIVAAHAGASIVAETGMRGGTLNTAGHVRRFHRALFVTRMPAGAPHHDAHQMLLAGGANAVPPECDVRTAHRILKAAVMPLRVEARTPDFFAGSDRP